MHVKPLEGRVETLRDFIRNYAMFVASILTALALEQAGVAWHDHRAAGEATREIEQELKANLADVRVAMRSNDARAPALDTLTKELAKAIRDGRPKPEVVATLIQPAAQRFNLGFAFPTLQREAWERAVVNQSAAHIDKARLGKFSIAYAAQRDIGQFAFQGMSMVLSGTRMVDALNDAGLGQVEPIEYLRVMRQYRVALESVQSNLRDLETQLQAALGEAAAKPPAAASAASAG